MQNLFFLSIIHTQSNTTPLYDVQTAPSIKRTVNKTSVVLNKIWIEFKFEDQDDDHNKII